MENDSIKANENVYKHYRLRAAKYNEALSSRERASELLGVSTSTLANYELGITKTVPVDMVVLMADLYGAPELRNLYCKYDCPIGKFQALATEVKDLESITIKFMSSLDDDEIREMKKDLLRIANDGTVIEGEKGNFSRILTKLDGIASVISEIKMLAERTLKRAEGVTDGAKRQA